MRRQFIDAKNLDLDEQVIDIRRVTKVVKGGRNMRFSALVVVGDHNGHVGVGTGKALEVPAAIQKAVQAASGNLIKVSRVGTTIPHDIKGAFGAGKVLMMRSPEGTGVIAGGPVRSVLELAGIKDIRAKSLGSNNPGNMVRATIEGLNRLRTVEEVSSLRGKSKEEILGQEVISLAEKRINIKLVKSPIGEKPKKKKTLKALGLRKIRQVVEKNDTPQIRGMINAVDYLVEVEEI